MHSLILPNTDLNVSNICLGTGDYGASVSETDSFALLDKYFEAGGNFLDTAAIYADWTSAGKGSSERLLGRWLAQSKKEAVISTKGAHPELHSMSISRMSRGEVESDLEDSLRNLGRETVDLYFLHRDDPTVPVEEILEMLEAFVAVGKIRYYGFSNWKLPRAQAAANAAQKMGVQGFVVNQALWSLAQADMARIDSTLSAIDDDFCRWHLEHQVAVMPYTSQANGFFNKVAAGGFDLLPAGLKDSYDSPLNKYRFMELEKIVRAKEMSVTQVVLGYLLSQPFPTVPIVGCKNPAQLADSLSASKIRLDEESMKALRSTD